ncbi:TraL conjugative transposon family protein [Barnesiella sp. WM24]|uniref:TraL conjugative transposon family protein n=1 Tax=Barnesiella sp. WM24 TaxID=2558278 RepID=UPI0014312EB7|nr:TraL conjugative transposon family protein [Barnesiella sp. WM24]
MSPLYNKVWHGPKGKIRERLKKVCDDMPHKQRLTVVIVLLTAFILIAFFVFGHACYKMGAGHARQAIEIEHIQQLELSTNVSDYETAR